MLSQIIEALLFSTPFPLTLEQISRTVEVKGTKSVRQAIEELNQFYEKTERAFRIQKVAGGYQIRTESRYKKWIRQGISHRPFRFSSSVIETLTIVAYRQPVTRGGIESIRAVDSSYTLRTLLEKDLIKVAGREDSPGRPILYATTKTFLELFGLNEIKDLPTLSEFDIPLDNSMTPR